MRVALLLGAAAAGVGLFTARTSARASPARIEKHRVDDKAPSHFRKEGMLDPDNLAIVNDKAPEVALYSDFSEYYNEVTGRDYSSDLMLCMLTLFIECPKSVRRHFEANNKAAGGNVLEGIFGKRSEPAAAHANSKDTAANATDNDESGAKPVDDGVPKDPFEGATPEQRAILISGFKEFLDIDVGAGLLEQ